MTKEKWWRIIKNHAIPQAKEFDLGCWDRGSYGNCVRSLKSIPRYKKVCCLQIGGDWLALNAACDARSGEGKAGENRG